MTKVSVGQHVLAGKRKGVVETIRENGWVTVLLHGTDGWPFPTRQLFRMKELKRAPKNEQGRKDDFEEAPF